MSSSASVSECRWLLRNMGFDRERYNERSALVLLALLGLKPNDPFAKLKPLRHTEQLWKSRGLNVRSTLWDGPRGGAAFTVACLTLLAKAERPVWPWNYANHGLLAEAFPACQLHQWTLPYSGYASSYPSPEREAILERISSRIEIPDRLGERCRCSADALDAVLCLFAAKAAAEDRATVGDQAATAAEGWIAVDSD